ncbi:MAG: PTS sugar transporter subunit IIA [Syntrophobacteraceae bacterium]
MMEENRADAFLRMIRRARRGRLKIYLGYSAGVGKTWQMLEEGHRLAREGIDVVVGLVETHGRAETAALIEGLEVVPRRRREHRGIAVEEMDVDAVLARKPQVALVDELAHTNVPGSRNAKRYQDVQDLLAAGVHVISTLNLQHLESLYDTVEKVSGVKVRERIPDGIVADADEIVNVDLTTEDLRKRLEEGKIYPRDRVETALSNFFRKTNLEQLRELTLREIASQIDQRSRDAFEYETSPTPDQVMVCLSSRGPNSEKLLRYASRLAGRLNRNWYAVYVQTPKEGPTVIDSATQSVLSGTLTLAKQLGAMVFTYKGEDVVDTILGFAKEYRAGHIVIGSPGRMSPMKRLLGKKNVVERLIDKARGVTIVVLDTRPYEASVKSSTGAESLGRESVATAAAPTRASAPLRLSRMLSGRRIVVWKEPVSKEEALKALSEIAAKETGVAGADAVFREVMESEERASTFFNEGAAFPHVSVDGVKSPFISLGVALKGVTGVATENPIECVFFIMSPAGAPETKLEALSVASRAARSRHLFLSLQASHTPGEIMENIRAWEASE